MVSLFGQSIDYNKIILPQDVKTEAFEEKLVRLAWNNNPQNSIIKKDREIAEYEKSMATWSWLNQIRITGNLNELSINQNLESNILFPRYNFGLTIPLGIFIDNPKTVAIANAEVEKASLEINSQKLFVRNQVLKAYQIYLMNEKIFKLRSDITEDEYANFLSIEEKFEKGEVSLEDYKAASKGYNLELENRITAKNKYEISKLDLELLLGMPLEEVN
ncbi:MAG: outer membrane protein TolC [Sediminicola sp.]|jgi:outer membrane protein TolC